MHHCFNAAEEETLKDALDTDMIRLNGDASNKKATPVAVTFRGGIMI